ncbi:GNAT family N-acetyltransferase [Bosea lupini]|uniref:GNAT family N-acetyltransferase n=1 Tax=Bosea lupini TaxID=1036779 RepID=UPI001AD81C45|nr:GNAT family N-acetyltransferase [Bosea lupini]
MLEPQTLRRFNQWFAMERQRDEPGHRDLTEDQAWLRLCAREGMWAAFDWGLYYLLDAENDQMLGEVGFQFRRRGFGPEFDGFPETSWAVTASHQRRGFAAEAMGCVLKRYDRASEGRRAVALIDQANQPSLRLAEGLGFRRYSTAVFDNTGHFLLERCKRASS